MSRRGNFRDNAVAESFFTSLKKERIKKRIYKKRDIARSGVFDYIEIFYNREDATATSAASAQRPLKQPQNRGAKCLR
jgi:transposase InsO family protein